MKIHAIAVGALSILCLFFFLSCKDIVRTVERPPIKRSVTVTVPKAGSTLGESIPVRLKNVACTDLEVDVGPDSPFDVTVREGETATSALLVIEPNDRQTTKNPVKVKVTNTLDGSVAGEFEVTPDQLPWRTYIVSDKTYKFELVKMFHFDGGSLTSTKSLGDLTLFTANDSGDISIGDSVVSVTEKTSSVKGTKFTIWFDSAKNFTQDSFDYVEVKFRSDSGSTSEWAFVGEGGMCCYYAAGKIGIDEDSSVVSSFSVDFSEFNGGDSVSTQYSDASSEWVTMGFWNNTGGSGCLFVEDYMATEGSYSGTGSFKFPKGDYTVFYIDSEAGFTTEIDYIAFFKKSN